MPAHDIVRLGICHSPEGRKIFPRLTVLENLQMGAFSRRDRAGIAHDLERAYELFPILSQRRGQAGNRRIRSPSAWRSMRWSAIMPTAPWSWSGTQS